MKLTGKAKEQFEEWYSELVWSAKFNNDWYYDMNFMSPSHQWGIYQDWADSIGWTIEVLLTTSGDYNFYVNLELLVDELYPTRQEARNAAIEMLNEIINSQ